MSVDIDERAVQLALFEPAGPMPTALSVFTDRVRDVAWALCPKRSGHLASTIRAYVEPGPDGAGVVEATADYAAYVHNGTGVYGPRHAVIVARPGHVFAFPGRDGRMVFTTRIRGQRPQPFLSDALQRVSES